MEMVDNLHPDTAATRNILLLITWINIRLGRIIFMLHYIHLIKKFNIIFFKKTIVDIYLSGISDMNNRQLLPKCSFANLHHNQP
ncbi:hypothetical protein SAMN05660330_03533 [Desulforhopalus singaporensis]|uniref:Uncharacterized protein n=1 Tax=Desulforhopalus singaporensis TaxID=91360 RepID=A0A1H0UGQ8_9BACT|nr:hypothetical protein SAMN05660330_03533 [Desulforhopalus singaporensis]